jgi:hypothetical protein
MTGFLILLSFNEVGSYQAILFNLAWDAAQSILG